jgi:hypothetical protein
MNSLLQIMIKVYRFLLHLYPGSFRSEFEEQMLLDFEDMAIDARKNGFSSLMTFGLQELVDFPINFLQTHMKAGSLRRAFRSQTVNYGLRGALGYGVVFGLAILISEFVILKLFIDSNSIIGNLQVLFFDWFHTEHGLELIGWLPNAIASLLSGLVLGVLFAVLFADRPKYGRYILVGMLGWFLHDAVTTILWYSANLNFFLGDRHTVYLSRMELVLSGVFLALIFIAAKSEKKAPVRLLVVGSFAFPLISYFYIRLLFKLSIIETPWMFIALMSLMVVYIGSIFMVISRSGLGRKAVLMMVAGTLVYQLLPYILHTFLGWISLLIPFPIIPPAGLPSGSTAAWQLYLRIALDQSIYGTVFGLIMGLMFGLFNKSKPQQVMRAI